MIRLVIAEDTYLVREGIRRLLEPEADIEVVAACEDLPSLLDAIESEQPDVVLTDIRMPPTSQDEGIQVADRLRETNPETGVVVLSQFAAPEYALALLEKGADRRAYLLKDRVGDAAQLAGDNPRGCGRRFRHRPKGRGSSCRSSSAQRVTARRADPA